MSYLQKRKRTEFYPEPHWLVSHERDDELQPVQSLCIEAHEADLVRGKESLALALETPDSDAKSGSLNQTSGTRGSGLIKWDGGQCEDGVWVDRFDARLLLTELPECCSGRSEASTEPGSPFSTSGWSDLPSDTEDAFFLSPSEVADMRYSKRRRMLEDARTERLAALRAAEGDATSPEDEDVWGGSDEEPDETQMMLMERTAAHLQTSPDRTRLTARILANHGADKRFAFMRGRWRRAWLQAQAKVAASTAAEEDKKKIKTTRPVLMDLATYGDSDEDESEVSEALEAPVKEIADEAAKMEARRARAREWAAKRRVEKDISRNPSDQ